MLPLVVFVVVSNAAVNAARPPKQPQPQTFVPVASAAASCAGFNLTAVSFGGLQPNEQKYLILLVVGRHWLVDDVLERSEHTHTNKNTGTRYDQNTR